MGVRLVVRSCWGSRSEEAAVYEFDQTRILLGRGRGADVRLPHRAVSLRHASIELDGTRYALVDHATTNGTCVQGARVVPDRKKPLRDGDRIEIGGFAIEFSANVPIANPASTERTTSLARRLAREALSQVDDTLNPFLTILNGPSEGRVVPLSAPPSRLMLGRDSACDVELDDADASRQHALIESRVDGTFVLDQESKNGVVVSGRRVKKERLLQDRDEITIGATVLRFEDPAAAVLQALDAGDDERGPVPAWADIQPKALPPADDEPTVADEAPEPALPSVADSRPKPAAPRRAGVAAADMVIYVLASVVFALSVLGLLWLLGSS